MSQPQPSQNSGIHYEASENPPTPLVIGLGLQLAVLCIAGIVLTPAIVIRAAGGSPEFLTWAVFVAVLISGITTMLQAIRVGRIGAGYVLLMGTSGAFIAVCITALQKGGPAMLCTLIVISSLFQFALSARLAFFRKIFTPAVSGTVIMLIAVTVMPIVFDMLKEVPEDVSSAHAALVALVTIVVMVAIALKAKGQLRLWAPVIGIVAGSGLSIAFGMFDFRGVAEAGWIGWPSLAWPGLDLSFNGTFWVLLPSFILVTIVGAIETIGDSIAIQRVSWRNERAVDYRAVQGAVNTDGVGNLLAGIFGTVPNTTYSTSVSVTELTGVASRRVGIAIGVVFIAFALFPKFLATILAIPGPVVSAYITVLLSMLFVMGMRIATQDIDDYRKAVVIGVSFWLGVGFQGGVIFPEFFSVFAGGLFQNGMTAGGLAAILMTGLLNLAKSRQHRITLPFTVAALPEMQDFLAKFASTHKWDESVGMRLHAAAEETLLSMLDNADDEESESAKRVFELAARKEDSGVVMEFRTTGVEENLQDQVALLREQSTFGSIEKEVSLRLLKQLAQSVKHQQYHDTQLVTLEVALQPKSDAHHH
ncbi:MAG: purine/pyrimidine permease [Gammaproteobacteria bacterium]|nr:purine/pyrimidine permease [Gammaproteobacteria bacterium]